MITGDNPLTACHVAKELRFTRKSGGVLILTDKGTEWVWEDIEQTTEYPVDYDYRSLVGKHDLCITGEVSSRKLISVFTKYSLITNYTNNFYLLYFIGTFLLE